MYYQTHRWLKKIWQTETRYYRAEIKQDLFGEWILERHWYGLWQKGGRLAVELLKSPEEGLSKMRTLEKRRIACGYQEVRV